MADLAIFVVLPSTVSCYALNHGAYCTSQPRPSGPCVDERFRTKHSSSNVFLYLFGSARRTRNLRCPTRHSRQIWSLAQPHTSRNNPSSRGRETCMSLFRTCLVKFIPVVMFTFTPPFPNFGGSARTCWYSS